MRRRGNKCDLARKKPSCGREREIHVATRILTAIACLPLSPRIGWGGFGGVLAGFGGGRGEGIREGESGGLAEGREFARTRISALAT
jgi:hypothetical protein